MCLSNAKIHISCKNAKSKLQKVTSWLLFFDHGEDAGSAA